MLLGEEAYLYGPEQYLVVSVDLPVVGQVVDATLEKPYLCFRLDLDAAILGELLSEAGLGAAPGKEPGPGLALSPADGGLLDAAVRLARLLDAPQDAGVLAPLAEREILYRLLTGEQAEIVRRIALSDGRLGQVRRAIGWIKEHYREPFSVEEVASEARMGTSALHHHFKAVTNMSPLQYQKRLRLQEARRLIMGSSLDAASAGFNVGYGSPSQFSREYGRLFGAPPHARRGEAQELAPARGLSGGIRARSLVAMSRRRPRSRTPRRGVPSGLPVEVHARDVATLRGQLQRDGTPQPAPGPRHNRGAYRVVGHGLLLS